MKLAYLLGTRLSPSADSPSRRCRGRHSRGRSRGAGREAARRRLVAADLPGAGRRVTRAAHERPRAQCAACRCSERSALAAGFRVLRQGRRLRPAFSRLQAGYALDFKKYVWPPRNRPGEKEFVYEELVWAREANGVLYVQNAHLTYARSSYGQNAYITAFDAQTKRRLWRSSALVANAQTFAVTPDYLITGYGFTAEPDWLYLLDRRTGRVVERLSLPERAREDHAQRQALPRPHVRPRPHRRAPRALTCSASATVPRSRRPSGVHRRRRRRSATCSPTGRSSSSSTSGTGRARERPRWSSCVTGGRSSRRRA